MKWWILAGLLLLGGCAGFANVDTNILDNSAKMDKDTKLAILPSSKTLFNTMLPDALATELIGYGFNVVERGELAAILKEYQLSLSGLLEESNYYALNSISNIDYIVIVNSRETIKGDVSSAIVKIVDIKNSKVILSVTYSQPETDNHLYIGYQNINKTARYIAYHIYDVYKHNGFGKWKKLEE